MQKKKIFLFSKKKTFHYIIFCFFLNFSNLIGYFARVNAIRSVVLQFLDTHRGQPCQIINLGAGYDTLYFNLADQNNLPSKYVEIDFPRVVSSKVRLIKSKKVLYEKLQNSKKTDSITDSAFNETTTTTSQSVFNSTDGSGLFKLPTPISASFVNRSNDSQHEINTNNFSLVILELVFLLFFILNKY